MKWVIPRRLARSSRPGYESGRGIAVGAAVVESWCQAVHKEGVNSILCLLADEHLNLYRSLPAGGLLETYQAHGFEVGHVPVADYKQPALDKAELGQVWDQYQRLPGPVLVHCSAGVDRTGLAIRFLCERLEADQNAGPPSQDRLSPGC